MSDTSGNVIRPGASGEQGPDADPEMDPIRSVANIQCSVSKSSSVFLTVNFGVRFYYVVKASRLRKFEYIKCSYLEPH